MKIMYIPLDERPCNYQYPSMIAGLKDDIELIIPPLDLLGKKKEEADTDRLWNWMKDNIVNCNALVLSIEMFVYGGLVPSRIHHMSIDECLERLQRIKLIKEINPGIKIYASNLIMRTPSYNSSDEEPDYYGDYGKDIFTFGYLTDKEKRGIITPEEIKQIEALKNQIPSEYLNDYIERRKINLAINQAAIMLVKNGFIHFLSIPQDDCSEFGFTPMDHTVVERRISNWRLNFKIYNYPGADEVGCTLLSRAYNEYYFRRPKVYTVYSSVYGPFIVPHLEDRPIGESVKAHITAAGGWIADSPDESDFILLINTPGKEMQASIYQKEKDITYSSYRNLREFAENIKKYIIQGKKCVVADVAFINGGDTELVYMMDDLNIMDHLYGYAGWNTVCNTMGTAIATGLIGYDSNNDNERIYNLAFRFMEDWCYQSIVRQDVTLNEIQNINGGSTSLGDNENKITAVIKDRLNRHWSEHIKNSFKDFDIVVDKVYAPWHRMFEIGMDMYVQPKKYWF